MADTGTGATIVFGTSAFTAEIMSMSGNDISRADIDDTHLTTTGYRTYIPSDLLEGGTVEFEFAFDPDSQPPIDGAAETITITFPIPAGDSSGATLAFTGYINNWSWSVPLEEKMTGSATIKVDGKTDPVWTDAA